MSSLEILRKAFAARKNTASMKQIKWDDLPLGNYRINYLKMTDTNYGPKVNAYLKDKPNFVTLPPRLADVEGIDQEALITDLNSMDNLWMKWMGKDKARYNFLQIDFFAGMLINSLFFLFLAYIVHFFCSFN